MTQWFERARLEWHPDRPTRPLKRTVVLGLLGAEVRAPLELPQPGDLGAARRALQTFFAALHGRRYVEAVDLYGGSYTQLRAWNPAVDDFAGLLKQGCEHNGLQCLNLRRIVAQQAAGARAFQFVVEFTTPDGSLFQVGPCCGATEAQMAAQTQFPYIVTKTEHRFLVQGLPVFVP